MPPTGPDPPLHSLPGFDILSPAEEAIAHRLVEAESYRKGDVIACSTDVHIIGSGTLGLRLSPPPPRLVTVGMEEPGGLLGEIGLFARDAPDLVASAETDALCYRLSRRAVKTSFHYSRSFAVKFMTICARGLSRKVRTANQALQDMHPAVRGAAIDAPLTPLNDADLRRLQALSATREHGAGQYIFEEGEASRELYVISRGEVEILTAGEAGTTLLARLGPGEFFGEMAFVDQGRRSAAARALTPLRLQVLPAGTLEHVLDADPGVALYLTNVLCKILANRLSGTLHRIAAAERPA